jgi:NAD-dependent deacetylase
MTAPLPDHEALAALLLEGRSVVVMTGLSLGRPEDPALTEADGTWARRASLEAFLSDPAAFWDFYLPAAEGIAAREPHSGHRHLARLEQAGIVAHLITQAVDRLHARAGSVSVVEVYGNTSTARCERCGEVYGMQEVRAIRDAAPDGVPRCTNPDCNYPLRSGGTLWGEPLPAAAVARAWELAAQADVFMVLDSSLRTIPVSLLPSVPLTRDVPLVIVGETPTQYDRYARLVIRRSSTQVLAEVVGILCPPSPEA